MTDNGWWIVDKGKFYKGLHSGKKKKLSPSNSQLPGNSNFVKWELLQKCRKLGTAVLPCFSLSTADQNMVTACAAITNSASSMKLPRLPSCARVSGPAQRQVAPLKWGDAQALEHLMALGTKLSTRTPRMASPGSKGLPRASQGATEEAHVGRRMGSPSLSPDWQICCDFLRVVSNWAVVKMFSTWD